MIASASEEKFFQGGGGSFLWVTWYMYQPVCNQLLITWLFQAISNYFFLQKVESKFTHSSFHDDPSVCTFIENKGWRRSENGLINIRKLYIVLKVIYS